MTVLLARLAGAFHTAPRKSVKSFGGAALANQLNRYAEYYQTRGDT